jgi:hypothetical protein
VIVGEILAGLIRPWEPLAGGQNLVAVDARSSELSVLVIVIAACSCAEDEAGKGRRRLGATRHHTA